MKYIKIRQNVFETNSSSTHSISIAQGTTKDLIDIPKVDNNGVVELTTSDYGWDYVEHKSLNDKLSYVATFAINFNADFKDGSLIYKDNKYKQMLISVVKDITGADEVNFLKNEGTSWEYGYIDRQSWDKVRSAYNTKETLKQFLFNPKSYFTTGNDNG